MICYCVTAIDRGGYEKLLHIRAADAAAATWMALTLGWSG